MSEKQEKRSPARMAFDILNRKDFGFADMRDLARMIRNKDPLFADYLANELQSRSQEIADDTPDA